MCGILGYSGDFQAGALGAGLEAMAHRGPDDRGEFFDSDAAIGLGHVRLSIQDLSPLGHQPMTSSDGEVTIVFNGEIYNFKELRADLESTGHQFIGRSDTEVLLHLYLEEGEAMLPRLKGIFAFAIWDHRNDSLLLSRDAFGVKPLYYAQLPEGIVFGSEIKGMLPLMPGDRELDHASIKRYVSFLWCPGSGTPLSAVRKMEPGEAMIVRRGQIERRWSWYQLPVARGVVQDQSEEQSIMGTLAALRTAVHRQLVSDVPVGAFLSGGLDSSAIVALAKEESPNIRCFTIASRGGVEEGDADDLPYARRVAKHLGVPLDVVEIDSSSMAADLEKMVVQLDEPLGDPAPLNVLYISQLARSQGTKVLLSGAGGDDLFTGYRRHLALSTEHYWSWLPEDARALLESASGRLDQRRALYRRIAKLFAGAGLSGDARIVNYFAWAPEQSVVGLLSQELRTAMAEETAAQPLYDLLGTLPTETSRLDRMLALEQRFFLSDHNLIYTDKMSMATGVEVRVPFLDMDLVEYAARIPVRFKQRGRVGKWVLKKAMEPFLPHDVIYRPKSGFGAPLRRWMRNELSELLHDLLSPDSLRRRGLFDPEAVQCLMAANDAGKVDVSYTLLSLLCIEIWCRRYVDRSAEADLAIV
ncbi:MAG: asparagine synthase (glutamine-hydrolyzing) [bacterium]|nr:asparagine synthase (glutamine-hydrolyzing) [bacterium]